MARDILPFATLYHWDLPQPLEDAGGWVNRDTAARLADYAAVVGAALGDRVYAWSTINEPWCVAYLGYSSGVHAPGRRDAADAFAAVHHVNLAHGLAVMALRGVVTNDPQFSISLNLHALRGAGESGAEAVRRIDALGNRAFTGPLLHGAYPADLIEDTSAITDWAFVREGDTATIRQPLDFLGINYYTTSTVRMWNGIDERQRADGLGTTAGTPWPGADAVEFVKQDGPFTEMGWHIAPDGFEELLVAVHEEFPQLPLMITENGAAFADEVVDGEIHDADRIDYLRRHLTALHRVIQRGVGVRGYLLWTVMDNFEWSWGFTRRFGIVHVDYDTLQRTVKDSGRWYSRLVNTRRIPG